jgi:hypothetical protein
MDDGINYLLGASLRGGEGSQEPFGDFVRSTIGGGSGLVDGFLALIENCSDISARFDDDRFDALRGQFVTVGFG